MEGKSILMFLTYVFLFAEIGTGENSENINFYKQFYVIIIIIPEPINCRSAWFFFIIIIILTWIKVYWTIFFIHFFHFQRNNVILKRFKQSEKLVLSTNLIWRKFRLFFIFYCFIIKITSIILTHSQAHSLLIVFLLVYQRRSFSFCT